MGSCWVLSDLLVRALQQREELLHVLVFGQLFCMRTRPKGPVTLLPGQAKKRSGSLPRISRSANDNVPDRASAKLCIDTRGKVTSVHVLTQMRESAKKELIDGLRDWRYAPHKVDGEAVTACFAVPFKIGSR